MQTIESFFLFSAVQHAKTLEFIEILQKWYVLAPLRIAIFTGLTWRLPGCLPGIFCNP